MSLAAALILAASVNAAPMLDAGQGGMFDEAHIAVRIVRPVIVRQAGGLQDDTALAPQHQLTRRGDLLLFEFQ